MSCKSSSIVLEKHRALFELAPYAIFIETIQGQIIDCNLAACQLFGYSKENLIGLKVKDLVSDEFAICIPETITEEYTTGNTWVDRFNKRKDGNCFPTEICTKIAIIDGCKRLITYVHDMTEYKIAQDILKISEERLMLAMEAVSGGLWDWDVRLGKIYFSPQYFSMLGYQPGEIIPTFDNWLNIVHPSDHNRVLEEINKCLNNIASCYEIEFRILKKTGDWCWILSRGKVVMLNEDGKVARMTGTHIEITERKQAQQLIRDNNVKLEELNEKLIAANEELSILDKQRKQQIDQLNENRIKLDLANQKLLDIIDFLPDATYVIDEKGIVIAWNRAIEKMTGVSKDDMIGKGEYAYAVPFFGKQVPILIDCFAENGLEIDFQRYNTIQRDENRLYGEMFIPALNNSKGAYLFATAAPLFDQFGHKVGAIESIRDISERKQKEEDIRFSEAKYRFLFNHMLNGFIYYKVMRDNNGEPIDYIVLEVNDSFETITGLQAANTIGQRMSIVFPGQAQWIEICNKAVKRDEAIKVEYYWDFIDIWVDASIYTPQKDYVAVVFSDITESKLAAQRLKYVSIHDGLTGLYNRMYFEEEMNRLKNGRYAQIGIVVCDIDGLKLINDTLGHLIGDEILSIAAKIFKNAFRDGDVVARIGGDEFAVIVPAVTEEGMIGLCQRVKKGIDEYNSSKPGVHLSISTGYAISNKSSVIIESLFKEADNNMYREKVQKGHKARNDIVQSLIERLINRDRIGEGHADRMVYWTVNLGQAVGLSKSRLARLSLLARFHDIGKVGISDSILFNPGQLTDNERQEMRRHCEIGQRIAQSAPELNGVADLILKHHEWWNGKGYPLGLKGEEIPMECRILAIVDAYDSMTHLRPYGLVLTEPEALDEIIKNADSQFDPRLVQKFAEIHACIHG